MQSFTIAMEDAVLLSAVIEAAIHGKTVEVYGDHGTLVKGEARYIENFGGEHVNDRSELVVAGTHTTASVRLGDIRAIQRR